MDHHTLVSTIKTSSGVQLHTRLIAHEDRERLLRFFYALTPETRRRRFHIDMESVDPKVIRARSRSFVDVDNATTAGAILALDDKEEIAGVARLVRIGAQPQAEAAIVVRDDVQGQGVGKELLQRLVVLGRRMEIETMIAEIESDNDAAIRTFRSLHLPTKTSFDRGTTILEILLGEC